MEELYLNDIRIELPERAIARTLQVNDLGEIKDRQSNYSNNIKIPDTKNNIAALEMLGITGNTTGLPYEEVSVKYVIDGIELISGGKGVIKSTSSFYSLIIYDTNVSMKDLLGSQEMKSLSFSAYNHTLTESIFTGSFSNTAGYIYGLGRFYSGASTAVFSIEVTSPSFYVHTLFSNIFTQKGYTITGSCLTDPDYLARVISMNNGFESVISESKTQVFDRDNSSDPNVVSTTFFGGQQKDFIIDSYTAVTTINHTISLIGSLNIVTGSDEAIKLSLNGATIFNEQVDGAFDFDLSVQMESGDDLDIIVAVSSDSSSDIEFSTEYATVIDENSLSIPIDFADIIGDIRQIDFVKDIMQHYGMLFRKTRNVNEFEFVCIKDILTDKANAEDWSDKYSRVLNESYNLNYAQENDLNYLYDSTESDTTPTFGDGAILVDNENLRQQKTMFTSIFKASELTGTTYYKLIHWVDEDDQVVPNDDGTRIFKINLVTGSMQYKFKLDGTGGATFTGTIPSLVFVSYQTNINSFYLEFKSMLSTYKKIQVDVNLSIVDIYNIDFFKLKYFEQLGQYYYLNKVVNFKNNRVTKVELLQVGADVDAGLEMVGSYAGSSVYDATLSKSTHGQIAGSYAGSSSYSGTLRLVVFNEFPLSTTGTSEGAACALSTFASKWHDGPAGLPAVNDTVYIDALGVTPLVGSSNFYKTGLGFGDYKLKINNSGLVLEKISC